MKTDVFREIEKHLGRMIFSNTKRDNNDESIYGRIWWKVIILCDRAYLRVQSKRERPDDCISQLGIHRNCLIHSGGKLILLLVSKALLMISALKMWNQRTIKKQKTDIYIIDLLCCHQAAQNDA